MSTTSQHNTPKPQDPAFLIATPPNVQLPAADPQPPAASPQSPQIQHTQHSGQENMATRHENPRQDDGASTTHSPQNVQGAVPTITPTESEKLEEEEGEGRVTTSISSPTECPAPSSTVPAPDASTVHDPSAVPTNTSIGYESQGKDDKESRATAATATSSGNPMPSPTAHPLPGLSIHNHSAVPRNTPTEYESQEEDDEESRAYLTPPEHSTPSFTFQSLDGDAIHDHSAVPTITTTGYEGQEQQDEEGRATSSEIEERRPRWLTLHVAARGQSAHTLDSSDSAVTPALSTAGATVGDSEDMDGRATPGDRLSAWSGGSVVSIDEGTSPRSLAGAMVDDGEENRMAMHAAEEDEERWRRWRHDTSSAPTEGRENYDEWSLGPGGDEASSEGDSSSSTDRQENNDGWLLGPGEDEASSGGEGSDLGFELTRDLDYALRRREEDELNPPPIPMTVWNISRPVEEQQRHAAQHASDVPFTPQTPTHTPVVPAHLSRGALAADHLIPALNLAADQNQDVHGENGRQGSNAENSRRSEDSANGLTLVPSNEGVRNHSWHVVNGPNQALPGPDEQINLRLPNPENLPTFQLLVTVPYRSGTIWPVSAHFVLPPNQPQDEIDDDQTAILNIEVDRAMTYNNDDVETVIHVGRRDASPTAQFVAQLPQVSLSEINAEDQECSICREVFSTDTGEVVQGEQIPEHPVRTPCGHIVGNQCLLRWLFGEPGYPPHSTCPSCRGHLEVPQSPESRPRVYSMPQDFGPGPDVQQPQPPNQEIITDEELETQLLMHLRHWTPEAERDSLGHADQSSWDYMRHRNPTAARDAALAQDLIPTAIYNAIPTYEAEQHLLFEAVRLRGFLGYPYISPDYGPRRVMDDEQVYEHLRSLGAHFYNRLGNSGT